MRLALCIGQQHSPGLLLLAVLVCLAGSTTTAHLFVQARSANTAARGGWLILTALASGAMVWATHFVAMMSFHAGAPVTLDPWLTLASLAVAIVGAAPGLALAMSSRRPRQWLGGALVGGAVAAMHYTGMAAYRVDGFVTWDAGYVAASIAAATGVGALAFRVLGGGGRRRAVLVGGLLLGAAVALLHFTGMAALTIIPAPLQAEGLSKATKTVLALATVFAGLLITACTVASALIDGHTREDSYRRLRRLALLDTLTELPNRAAFNDDLGEKLTAGERLAVVMIDLCGFKAINDKHGHQCGDQLLVALAARLTTVVEPQDAVYRLGGDEFAAILPLGPGADPVRRAQRLTAAFEAEFTFARFATRCGASMGVSLAPDDGRDADRLLANADLAMYRAKRARSHDPLFYEAGMDKAVRDAREMASDLRLALGGEQFRLFYQVQASLETGRISGYEALARWTDPSRGSVSPGVFIPMAEELGEIDRLGAWVLEAACREAAAWPVPHPVAVNVSPLQLGDAELVARVAATLAASGLKPQRLEIELTESALVTDRGRALQQLRGLKSLGVTLALDDFGAGYSSLDVLRAFPFDRIKLDASFVAEIETDRQAVAIFNSVAALGRTLRIPVLAEGVETHRQLALVADGGCSDVQGYLLGRPARDLVDEHGVLRTMSAVTGLQRRLAKAA